MATPSSLLPPPRALLIFEAAARRGSCSAAAREFNLTQPSVSRNIAELEGVLKARLFVRKPDGLELTADGALLYRTMSEVLARISDTVREIGRRNEEKDVVELSLSTAFVTHWLVPRMRDFQASFPDVDLRFELMSGSLRGAPGNVDLAMRRVEASDLGDRCWSLAPEIVLPVASRAYIARKGPIEARRGGHVLIELSDSEIGWETMLGDDLKRVSAGGAWMEFSDYAVVLQTAIAGQGVALGWVSAVSRLLIDGTLVPAGNRRHATGRHFCLMAPRGRPIRAVVLRIRDWLMAEMQRELAGLEGRLAARPSRPRR